MVLNSWKYHIFGFARNSYVPKTGIHYVKIGFEMNLSCFFSVFFFILCIHPCRHAYVPAANGVVLVLLFVNFEHISHLFLLFLFLTSNI